MSNNPCPESAFTCLLARRFFDTPTQLACSRRHHLPSQLRRPVVIRTHRIVPCFPPVPCPPERHAHPAWQTCALDIAPLREENRRSCAPTIMAPHRCVHVDPVWAPPNVSGDIDMEPFLGQLQLFPYSFAPQGWAPCDGQLLPIAQNTALFSLLGTTSGGDGRTTFALPKLAGPAEA